MAIRRDTINLTVDSGGDASGRTNIPVNGVVLAIYFNFSDSYDATTTLTIDEDGEDPPLPVLTLTNVNTDGWYYPRVTLHDVADGSAIVGPVDYQSVADYLIATVANGTEDDTVAITIVWDDVRR